MLIVRKWNVHQASVSDISDVSSLGLIIQYMRGL